MIRRPPPQPEKKKVALPSLGQIAKRLPRRVLWQGKIAPAFWTLASIFSLIVNFILLMILILLGRQLFALKTLMQDGLIGGLYQNFVLMDQARIQTTVEVNETIQVVDQIPVVFDLPLHQNTVVVLVEDTTIPGATVYLNSSAVKTTVVLPQGTPLNIALNLSVPVNTIVPVTLNVPVSLKIPVDIPLNQTELHQPFTGLQQVVLPYQELLTSLPDSWAETPICSPLTLWLCRWIFGLP
jgi:hypothetical protein